MNNEYIEVSVDLSISGYSRGSVEGTAFYDKKTGELVDWEYDLDTYGVHRNDMDVDTGAIPQTVEVPDA